MTIDKIKDHLQIGVRPYFGVADRQKLVDREVPEIITESNLETMGMLLTPIHRAGPPSYRRSVGNWLPDKHQPRNTNVRYIVLDFDADFGVKCQERSHGSRINSCSPACSPDGRTQSDLWEALPSGWAWRVETKTKGNFQVGFLVVPSTRRTDANKFIKQTHSFWGHDEKGGSSWGWSPFAIGNKVTVNPDARIYTLAELLPTNVDLATIGIRPTKTHPVGRHRVFGQMGVDLTREENKSYGSREHLDLTTLQAGEYSALSKTLLSGIIDRQNDLGRPLTVSEKIEYARALNDLIPSPVEDDRVVALAKGTDVAEFVARQRWRGEQRGQVLRQEAQETFRTALWYRQEGWSASRIAEAMGKTTSAINQVLSAGRKKIRSGEWPASVNRPLQPFTAPPEEPTPAIASDKPAEASLPRQERSPYPECHLGQRSRRSDSQANEAHPTDGVAGRLDSVGSREARIEVVIPNRRHDQQRCST